MPFPSLIGAFVSIFILSAIVAIVLMLVFKRGNRQWLQGISVGLAVLIEARNGAPAFFSPLVVAVPVWFLLRWLTRRSRSTPPQHSHSATPKP